MSCGLRRIADYPKVARAFFLALAALNLWISWTIFPQHQSWLPQTR